MSVYNQGTNNDLTVKKWAARSEELFRDVEKKIYFKKFMGMSSNSLIKTKGWGDDKSMKNHAGDTVTFGISYRLDEDNHLGEGATISGNEQSLDLASYKLNLTEFRQGVATERGLTAQRSQLNLERECVDRLKTWIPERCDKLIFNAYADSPLRTLAPTTAAAGDFTVSTGTSSFATEKAKIANNAQQKLTPELISRLKPYVMTGANRRIVPLKPVMVEGKSMYVLLVHPDVAADLRNNATYSQAKRDAEARGSMNPIFTGALGMWHDFVIHEHENMPIFTDGGSGGNVPGAHCFVLGAESLCWTVTKRPNLEEEETNYKHRYGVGTSMIYGVGKPTFDFKGTDFNYGSIALVVNRTRISDK